MHTITQTSFPAPAVLFLKSRRFANQPGYYLHNKRWHRIDKGQKAPSGTTILATKHYQKAALKKLKGEPGFKSLPDAEQAAKVKELASKMQKIASASAAVSMWKKNALAGKNPTPAQWKAFYALKTAKQAELLDEVKGVAGMGHLQAPAVPVSGDKAKKVEAAAQQTKPEPKAETLTGSDLAKLPDGAVIQITESGKPWRQAKKVDGKWYLAKLKGQGWMANPLTPQQHGWLFGGDYGEYTLVSGGDAPAAKEPASKPGPAQAGPNPWTDEQWAQLELPTSNTNHKSHNNKIAAMKAAADAGDLAALQAMTFGSNTYGKKQAKIAEHLIAEMTSGAAPAADPAPTPAAKPDAKPAASVSEPKELRVIPAENDGYEVHITESGSGPDAGFSVSVKDESGKFLPTVMKFKTESEALDHALLIAGKKKPAASDLTEPVMLQNTSGNHNKFYSSWVDGNTVHSHYGKIGTKGQKIAKEYGSPEAAKVAHEKLVASKKKGGYQQVSGGAAPAAAASSPQPEPAAPATKNPWTDEQWSQLYLPDTNTNAPSHNKKIDALKAAADAGDVAAIQAMKFGKNTYGKKQAKVAEHLLAEMSAAKPDDGPKEGDIKQGADGLLIMRGRRWRKLETDESPKSLIDGWSQAIIAGKVPTKEQAEAVEAMDDDEKMDFFFEHYAAHTDVDHDNDPNDVIDDAHDAAIEKVSDLHYAALEGTAPVEPEPAPAPATAASPSSDVVNIDHWKQVGAQQGSNPGGLFEDEDGQKWYCKFPSDPDHAKSEILTAELYKAAGIAAPELKPVTHQGKSGLASKWKDGLSATTASKLAKAKGALDGFAVDAWLGNWDVIGLANDNLQVGPDGKAFRVDVGGSLEYRAQGAKKAFGAEVTELDSMRDKSVNPKSAAVFGKMSKADIAASVAKIAAIPDDMIEGLVEVYGPGTQAQKAALAKTLIARKADLLKKYPAAVKAKKKPVFKPEKISTPPSFLDWGGSGKPGPSSLDFINQANHDAVTRIHEAAKSGDPEKVKALSFPVYDKDTGKVSGSESVLKHPSQHVKGYAQQVLNEINYQMNPPKRFRFEGGHPLQTLHESYPPFTGNLTDSAIERVGKFIVLGNPGIMDLENAGLPDKITFRSKALTRQTYSPQAHAAISKMPQTQRQALRAYTGSGYKKMNSSLWSGNPVGQAKSAAEALHTLGHDIQPGTVLSRRLSISSKDLNDLIGSVGKVLQEPAIMSTSIRPSSWSGSVQLKLHVGPGVKGLWVGRGSTGPSSALSVHESEDEMVLPPNTRLLILSSKKTSTPDADGFGGHGATVIEAIVLPTQA